MKNIQSKIKIIIMLSSTFLLSWCFWDSLLWLPSYTDLVCGFNADSDHCIQSMAIQNADVKWCNKIKWAKFAAWGSNPPKDKCYLLIAENTWDMSACNNIKWWISSYTKEECINWVATKFHNPSWCLQLEWSIKQNCINAISWNLTVWEVIDMDKQIELLKWELAKWEDPELQKQLEWLEKRRDDYVTVLPTDKKESYKDLTDPLNKEIRLDSYLWKIDEKSKKSLLALNKLAIERWETMPKKEYEAIRDMLVYKNDPKNDIEQMDDDELVKLRRNEKIAEWKELFKFWKANKTKTEEKQDQSLLFYKRMLERQVAIDKWLSQKQQDFKREYDKFEKKVKDDITGAIKDEAKKYAFWELLDIVDSPADGPTTAILWEAINVVKEHAQSSMFRWMVWAYNKWMEEELANHNWNIEKAHEAVTKNLKQDAYRYEDYADWITFAKYGNLMENKECSDKNKNPLCLNKDIFFKAMKKSYKYQNK